MGLHRYAHVLHMPWARVISQRCCRQDKEIRSVAPFHWFAFYFGFFPLCFSCLSMRGHHSHRHGRSAVHSLGCPLHCCRIWLGWCWSSRLQWVPFFIWHCCLHSSRFSSRIVFSGQTSGIGTRRVRTADAATAG